MPFALVIHETRDRRRERSKQEGVAEYDQMLRFGESLAARGLYQAAHALKPDSHGARVSLREGKPMVIDGPFSESKEMIGGIFLINCLSREEAIAIAAECPAAAWATVEVREIGTCHDE